MSTKEQVVNLAGGQELTVRQPIPERDLDRLTEFFKRLPNQLRSYLRYNVTDPELCRKRLELVDEKDHWRLVAELHGNIVGEGALDREPFGWTHHLAHVRIVVEPNVRQLGIGTVLLRRLVELGKVASVERFYCEVIKEHTEMIDTLEKEGFVYEITRKDYAKDIRGQLHDVIVLSNDQSKVWRKLEEHINELDIKMPRIFYGA